MGDEQTQPGTEVERLEREAAQKYWDLRAALEELDQARAQARASYKTPEERRRSFRLIQGGATVVGAAAVWAVESARRPVLAVALGAGALTTATLIPAPLVEPGTAEGAPVVVTETPVPVDEIPAEQDTQRNRRTPEPVAETPPPSAVTEVPVAPAEEPFTPTPTQTPKPKASPTPTPSPSASATAEVEDLVEIEVNAEDGEACVDSGLVGLELAVCLEGVR